MYVNTPKVFLLISTLFVICTLKCQSTTSTPCSLEFKASQNELLLAFSLAWQP